MRIVARPGGSKGERRALLMPTAPFDLQWKRGHWRGGVIAMVRPRPQVIPGKTGLAPTRLSR